MRRMRFWRIAVLVAAVALLWSALVCGVAWPATFAGGAWVGDVNAAAEGGGYQWRGNGLEEFLANPGMVWAHCQMTVPEDLHDSGPARDLIRTLARGGKRVTLQLWVNADGDLNWSYYSLYRIPRDEVVRGRLFSRCGECIDYVGAENLYAVYLWEETAGVNVGWDIAQPAKDWRHNYKGIVDGVHDGGTYVNRGWPIGRDKARGDGPYNGNARTQRDALLDKYGIDVFKADDWTEAEWRLWRLWVARDCLAATHLLWRDYVKRRWPHLRVYSWDYPAMAGDKFTDLGWQAKHGLDGAMVNPYRGPEEAYCWVRAVRTLFGPGREVHAVFRGDTVGEKERARLNGAGYAAGADDVSFFAYSNDTRFPVVTRWQTEFMRGFRACGQPVLDMPYPDLVVSDGYYKPAAAALRRLGRFDVVSSVDRYAVDERRYRHVYDLTTGRQVPWAVGG